VIFAKTLLQRHGTKEDEHLTQTLVQVHRHGVELCLILVQVSYHLPGAHKLSGQRLFKLSTSSLAKDYSSYPQALWPKTIQATHKLFGQRLFKLPTSSLAKDYSSYPQALWPKTVQATHKLSGQRLFKLPSSVASSSAGVEKSFSVTAGAMSPSTGTSSSAGVGNLIC
jgi:hypothetical protein